jgi:hypothetical protein
MLVFTASHLAIAWSRSRITQQNICEQFIAPRLSSRRRTRSALTWADSGCCHLRLNNSASYQNTIQLTRPLSSKMQLKHIFALNSKIFMQLLLPQSEVEYCNSRSRRSNCYFFFLPTTNDYQSNSRHYHQPP